MPSHRVNGSTVALELYDVLGQDGAHGLIVHVGLAALEGQQNSDTVRVHHMIPPLQTDDLMKADARGAAKLDYGEKQKFEIFKDRHEGEHAATRKLRHLALYRHAEAIYCIHPHAMPHREEDGRYVRTRFSCAGFVYEAYRHAGITLLDEAAMPEEVSLEQLKLSYPRFAEKLDDPEFRSSMGLSGSGDWRVMLCGYLLHALNRDAADIRSTPYVPTKSDAYFP